VPGVVQSTLAEWDRSKASPQINTPSSRKRSAEMETRPGTMTRYWPASGSQLTTTGQYGWEDERQRFSNECYCDRPQNRELVCRHGTLRVRRCGQLRISRHKAATATSGGLTRSLREWDRPRTHSTTVLSRVSRLESDFRGKSALRGILLPTTRLDHQQPCAAYHLLLLRQWLLPLARWSQLLSK
jgi:hypothetical protein